jgi:DNA-binding CsgD family transcriptional regulator
MDQPRPSRELADPTVTGDGSEWCPVAQALVYVDRPDNCAWCHTDHTLGSRITLRQLAGMQMLAQGKTRKVVAVELGVTETTVANDWRDVRMKLQARTTAHALAMLVREGSA